MKLKYAFTCQKGSNIIKIVYIPVHMQSDIVPSQKNYDFSVTSGGDQMMLLSPWNVFSSTDVPEWIVMIV